MYGKAYSWEKHERPSFPRERPSFPRECLFSARVSLFSAQLSLFSASPSFPRPLYVGRRSLLPKILSQLDFFILILPWAGRQHGESATLFKRREIRESPKADDDRQRHTQNPADYEAHNSVHNSGTDRQCRRGNNCEDQA